MDGPSIVWSSVSPRKMETARPGCPQGADADASPIPLLHSLTLEGRVSVGGHAPCITPGRIRVAVLVLVHRGLLCQVPGHEATEEGA